MDTIAIVITIDEIVCKLLKIEFTKGSIFDSRTEIKLLVLNFVKLKVEDCDIIF